ncbi:hypothetical protein AHF37_03103 [Paragonimus kellicotti]|nr:hypothetical protein AHF37_03103 [Paragonimus kellicotti]
MPEIEELMSAEFKKINDDFAKGKPLRKFYNRRIGTVDILTERIRTPDNGPVRAADNTDKREVNNLSEQHSVMTSKGLGPLQLWEGSSCEVDSLTLARDGGILDWDDRVIDVLDDREMVSTPGQKNDSFVISRLPNLVLWRCCGRTVPIA